MGIQRLMVTVTFAILLLVTCYFTLVIFQQMLEGFQEQNETETKHNFHERSLGILQREVKIENLCTWVYIPL